MSGADWEHWRGPDYHGISKESGWRTTWPAEAPKTVWKVSVGTGFCSVAVSRGRVYTIIVQCTDSAGHASTETVLVRVPHDRGHGDIYHGDHGHQDHGHGDDDHGDDDHGKK